MPKEEGKFNYLLLLLAPQHGWKYSCNSLTQSSWGLKFSMCYQNFCVIRTSVLSNKFIMFNLISWNEEKLHAIRNSVLLDYVLTSYHCRCFTIVLESHSPCDQTCIFGSFFFFFFLHYKGEQDPQKAFSFDNFEQENAHFFLDFTQSWGRGRGKLGDKIFLRGQIPPLCHHCVLESQSLQSNRL